jgi:hypothetical protein
MSKHSTINVQRRYCNKNIYQGHYHSLQQKNAELVSLNHLDQNTADREVCHYGNQCTIKRTAGVQNRKKFCVQRTFMYEICTLLGYNTVQSNNSVLKFQDNLSVPSSGLKKSKNYHSTLHNIPEEGRSHLHHGRSLKSCKHLCMFLIHLRHLKFLHLHYRYCPCL